ncbi:MAG: hypothetical protein NXI01_08595 [Gammaproteobacteria bacterium]|nr:hypothetical protein [Gammaproteobacteria bacterium]
MHNKTFKNLAPALLATVGANTVISGMEKRKPSPPTATPSNYGCHPCIVFSSFLTNQRIVSISFNDHALESFVPPSRKPHPVQDQCLNDWVSATTKDYQLLSYSPENLTIQIAFLRLIGISQISFNHLSREKGGFTCFINTLNITPSVESTIITSANDVIDSIIEFGEKTDIPTIRSLEPKIKDPMSHVKPSIITNAQKALNDGTLEQFYEIISQASDDKLTLFARHILGPNHGPVQENILLHNMQEARRVCQIHLESKQQMSMMNPSGPG